MSMVYGVGVIFLTYSQFVYEKYFQHHVLHQEKHPYLSWIYPSILFAGLLYVHPYR